MQYVEPVHAVNTMDSKHTTKPCLQNNLIPHEHRHSSLEYRFQKVAKSKNTYLLPSAQKEEQRCAEQGELWEWESGNYMRVIGNMIVLVEDEKDMHVHWMFWVPNRTCCKLIKNTKLQEGGHEPFTWCRLELWVEPTANEVQTPNSRKMDTNPLHDAVWNFESNLWSKLQICKQSSKVKTALYVKCKSIMTWYATSHVKQLQDMCTNDLPWLSCCVFDFRL